MKSSKKTIVILIGSLFLLIIGFIAGTYFSGRSFGRGIFMSAGNKMDVILDIINEQYVDTVNVRDLVEEAIPKLISELDPHSAYIPAEDLKTVNEGMEGHFSGIGVSFSIKNDTILVMTVISGGPSEKAGLQPGDRIITVNDSVFAGKNITQDKVMKNLRGEKGSKVKVGIKRNSHKNLLTYEIIRDDVPVNSVDIAYEVSKGIGFIKINTFGRTTYDEFINAIGLLKKEGCNSFIIDLRQNSGGLMNIAVEIVNEFLPKGRLIVYTQGRAFSRKNAIANGSGTCQQNPVVILMDDWSASASEIVAGAIQDNDRGLIIGRRSFGKGLVQTQEELSDGSALRLTIARYYTPSGRCIQKDYQLGNVKDYEQGFIDRFKHGELDSKDSIKQNEKLRFTTLGGRTVYGGGGIMPDVFIPRDTVGITSYYSTLVSKGIIYEYAVQYTDQNRERLTKFKDYKSLWNYLKGQPLLEGVVSYAETKNIRRRPLLIDISANLIENVTQAYIIRNIIGDQGFYPVFLDKDPVIAAAVEKINKKQAFPTTEPAK